MRYKKKFHKKKRQKDNATGLSVTVFNNNVDEALKRLKRIVKSTGLMQVLQEKEYFVKPSKIKREKKNLAMARARYQSLKEKENN